MGTWALIIMTSISISGAVPNSTSNGQIPVAVSGQFTTAANCEKAVEDMRQSGIYPFTHVCLNVR